MNIARHDGPVVPPRQQEVLHFIRAYIASRSYPPTVREIGAHLGIASTNGVHDHLIALRRRGLLTWERGKSRTLRVIG